MITSACIGIPAFNVAWIRLTWLKAARREKTECGHSLWSAPQIEKCNKGPGGLSGPFKGDWLWFGGSLKKPPKELLDSLPLWTSTREATLVAEPGRPTDFVESLVSPPCQLQRCHKTRAAIYGPCYPPSILQLTM